MKYTAIDKGGCSVCRAVLLFGALCLVLFVGSCGKDRQPAPVDPVLLKETLEWLSPPPDAVDTKGEHWEEAQRLLRAGRIPQIPLLLGAIWRGGQDPDKGALFITWLKHEQNPSTVSRIKLRADEGADARTYEFAILQPPSLFASSTGYAWGFTLSADRVPVDGITAGEDEYFGETCLLLRFSHETFDKGIWVSVVDDKGRSSNWLRLRSRQEVQQWNREAYPETVEQE